MSNAKNMSFGRYMADCDTEIQEALEQICDVDQQVKCTAAKERILKLVMEELKNLAIV